MSSTVREPPMALPTQSKPRFRDGMPGRMWRSAAPHASGPIQALSVIALLYVFLLSVGMVEAAFKVAGRETAEALIRSTVNPFVGLFIGILATSLMQSSSATTSIIVGMVAADALTVRNAVPFIMGANIGTSVTNTLVAMGSVTRRDEFRRSFAAATVHDFFNVLTVLALFPLEMKYHFLEGASVWIAQQILGLEGATFNSPVKAVLKPVTGAVRDLFLVTFGFGRVTTSVLLGVLGIGGLITALIFFSKTMKRIMARAGENVLRKLVGANTYLALLMGIVFTVAVQSSSITTSLMVPLVGTGLLSVAQIYPLTVGANIGTTVTAMLAALTGNLAAVTIALTHLCFNLAGLLLFVVVPFMRWPVGLAERFANLAAKRRLLALAYIFVVFFVIPVVLVFWKR